MSTGIEPNVLQRGWLLRCITNSVKLLLRSPIAALAIYLPALLLAGQSDLPDLPTMFLVSIVALLAGLILAFRSDSLPDVTVFTMIKRILKNPYIILVLVINVLYMAWRMHEPAGLGTPSALDPPSHPLLTIGTFFGFSIGLGLFLWGLSAIYMIVSIGGLLIKTIAHLCKIDIPWMFAVGFFTIPLIIEHDMSLSMAGEKDEEGFMRNSRTLGDYFNNFIAMLIIVFLGPISILVPGFLYCLYREVFYGPGLVERSPKKAEATTPAPVPASV